MEGLAGAPLIRSTEKPLPDRSNGYDAVASGFIASRRHSAIGAATVREWAKTLPPRGSVLDLGCGSGVPISEVLMNAGLLVHGVDASPAMIAAFQTTFPTAPTDCSAVEDSRFF